MVPAPVEGTVITWQMISVAVTMIGSLFGAVAGLLKWSLARNIAMMDAKLDQFLQRLEAAEKKVSEVAANAMQKADCSTCRKECIANQSAKWSEMVDWMRRLEDKFDRLILALTQRNGG